MRTLCLDIETTPILCWTWGLWNQNINPAQVVKPSGMLCWAAKWVGESDVEFRGLKPDGRKRMVSRLWKLVDEADAILHYNGTSFDIPRVQREMLELGMRPPSPFKQIDLLKTARKQFKFDSNKLDQVAKQLGIGRKVEHEGFALWLKCMDGEASAWDRMRRYNEHDVRMTEKVYVEKFRPWIVSHPSHAAFSGERVCPKCGGELVRRGYAVAATGKYQRWHCKACGGWSQDTKRLTAAPVKQIAA